MINKMTNQKIMINKIIKHQQKITNTKKIININTMLHPLILVGKVLMILTKLELSMIRQLIPKKKENSSLPV